MTRKLTRALSEPKARLALLPTNSVPAMLERRVAPLTTVGVLHMPSCSPQLSFTPIFVIPGSRPTSPGPFESTSLGTTNIAARG